MKIRIAGLLAWWAGRLDPSRPVVRASGPDWMIMVGGRPLYRLSGGLVRGARPGRVTTLRADPKGRRR